MRTVLIIEWSKRTGPTARWAGNYFEENGCRTVISTNWAATGGPVDLVYTPVPGLEKTEHIPLVTHLEGYGTISVMPGSKPSPNLQKTFENSSKVLLADPNMYLELIRCGLTQDTIMLPNPAPDATISPKKSPRFTVLYPSGSWWIKKPERVIQAARIVGKEEPDILFVMPIGAPSWKCPLDWLELDNIEFLPTIPYENMLKTYAYADVVAPFSAAEILPWTVFESFVAGKPTIVDVIGKVQSVHRKYLEEMVSWFGTPSRLFHEKWEDKYHSGEGDHYLHASSAEELARLIIELYHDEKRRLELGNNALEWVNAYKWTPKDKGKKILELVNLAP